MLGRKGSGTSGRESNIRWNREGEKPRPPSALGCGWDRHGWDPRGLKRHRLNHPKVLCGILRVSSGLLKAVEMYRVGQSRSG